MQRKVYRTKLRPERRDEYIEAHRKFSPELLKLYKDAGLTVCAVYLLDDDLVLVTESNNPERVREILSNHPLDKEWQAYVRPMKAEGDWQEMQELFIADLS
jgi:L-rhamnose mutarotase